jgi:hypothetical protein
MKTMEQEKANGDETEVYVMSIFQKFADGKAGKVQVSDATAEPTPIKTAPTLKSILKRAKNANTDT